VLLGVPRTQAVNYRLGVNNIATRLAPGSYMQAAHAGLQDTAPRDALLGLHARVEACQPDAWCAGPLSSSTRAAIQAEAASMPIPNADVSVSLTEH
jgi:hypothetical protein